MNILIITMNVGETAPGIVFERIIYGLSKQHKVDVYTAHQNSSIRLSNVHSIEVIPYFSIPKHRCSQLIFLFNINPIDVLWAYNVKKRIINDNKYDIVLSLISNEHYAALIAGIKISKLLNKRLAVYSVDAIPAPLGWSLDNVYFRSCKRFVRKYLSKADVFFTANEKMLEYQKTLLDTSNMKFDVMYNPSFPQLYSYKKSEKHVFLYTGEIYRVRRIKYLLRALQIVLKEYPKVELHFVGTSISEDQFQTFSEKERNAVKIFPRTNNLNPFYEQSCCLIDIDADIENDVYLSSKITNYIMINRPIICETGENSPSRHVFQGVSSILQCGHNSEEIYNAMKGIIECPITDFSDRDKVRAVFHIDNVIDKLNQSLFEINI